MPSRRVPSDLTDPANLQPEQRQGEIAAIALPIKESLAVL